MQRPYVLETVSLDLHLARLLGGLLRQLNPEGAKRVDVVSLLDEFAANFYRELDYEVGAAGPQPEIPRLRPPDCDPRRL